jgi:4-diphosphocytidyl-2-C-methyl-D-erythritol kinase
MLMNEIKVLANAKINLGLSVKHKRNDGFHEIESIFQEISFADELIIKKSNSIKFDTNSNELKKSGKNLCVEAAELLQKNYKIAGLDIFLDKRIPIGSGLGGGSSDAAAVLKSANLLFNQGLSNHELKILAEQIGSDVPFFIDGKSCRVSGRGEIIEQLSSDLDYYILLVFPYIKISTAEAYKSLGMHLTRNDNDYKFKSSILRGTSVRIFKNVFFNDFEGVVFKKYSNLLEIKNLLYQEQAEFASLSGSGSTVYGIYSSPENVNKAYKKLSDLYSCFVAKPVY